MTTPFFPALRPKLAPLGRRVAQSLRQTTLAQFQEQLGAIIPVHLLSQADDGPHSRDRCFNLRLTLECFVWQMLKPRTACREVVRQVQGLLRLHGRAPIDEGDAAYVQARQGLPRERMEAVLHATAQAAGSRTASPEPLQGRRLKLADGSTTQASDTEANQKRYPQSGQQKQGCGFPVVKFVVLFCLQCGAVLEIMTGNLHHHDLRLFRQLWDCLKMGDILLADRGFGEFTTLAGLLRLGVDVIARLHGARKVDFRKGKRLGKRDGLFTWQRGYCQSSIFSAVEWTLFPEQLEVRIIRFSAVLRGFRGRKVTLVTTLLDPKLYPVAEIIAAYKKRWRIELCLRDLKTTMGMEFLRCKTPDMVEKELLAYLIAHNMIRCVMAEAAATYKAPLERISFKGTVDAVRQYSDSLAKAKSKAMRRELWEDLLLNLGRDLVPKRPDRLEPRAIKRRPKPYPLLNKPRRKFREIPHRSRYWKARPRNYRNLN
jgi:hypothetical protein